MSWETTAWTSYVAAKRRAAEDKSANDLDLPETILDPDERVLDVTIGDTSREDDPVLIATDRRVILAERPAFRAWRVVKQAAGSEVVDATYATTMLAGRISVHLRDGSRIDLRSRVPAHGERFVATVRGLLGR